MGQGGRDGPVLLPVRGPPNRVQKGVTVVIGMVAVSEYPLVFTYQRMVFGRGFVVEVRAKGHILAVKEDDKWWLYGVHPGGIAASGTTPREALEDFRTGYEGVLHEIGRDAEDFTAFEKEIRQFFYTVDSDEARWNRAARRLAGRPRLDPALMALHLPWEDDPAPALLVKLIVEVVRPTEAPGLVQRNALSPQDNKLDKIALPQAEAA